MSARPLPVLWLAGPPGVGKTTVAREVWRRLRQDGVAAAYVSIDQLGMCVPPSADDPHQHGVKLANLAAVVPGFAAAGADCLVMCGVVDPEREREPIPGAEVTMIELRLSDAELRSRLEARGWASEMVEAALAESEAVRGKQIGDAVIDTDGLAVAAVADRVLEVNRGRFAGGDAEAAEPVTVDGEILWLCGPRAVGKSSVAWAAFAANVERGRTTGLVDLEQIGCFPDGRAGDALKARNLAAMWRVYHGRGARQLVVNGPLDSPVAELVYREALPNARFTVVRLAAGVGVIAERVARRAEGEGWREPGDDLVGLDGVRREAVVTEAIAAGARLAAVGVGQVVVDTDGATVAELAATVLAAAEW